MKITKVLLGVLAMLLITSYGSSMQVNQMPVPEEQKQLFLYQIAEASKKIQTLQCSFIQEKTSILVSEKAVAKGALLFQSPNMLRWEYTEPTPSTLILNGNHAVLLSQDGKHLGNERMLKQLSGIIISMINGEGVQQNKQFSSEIFDVESNEIRIVLTPIQKRLKDFYNKIELRIDRKTMLANDIILDEKSGDKTVILLANKMLNVKIPQSKFTIK